MSKESYIGGHTIEWIGGRITEYLDKATYSSGKKLVITADGTKNFGDNPETQEIKPGDYIIDAYWSRDFEGNQRITEAKLVIKFIFRYTHRTFLLIAYQKIFKINYHSVKNCIKFGGRYDL